MYAQGVAANNPILISCLFNNSTNSLKSWLHILMKLQVLLPQQFDGIQSFRAVAVIHGEILRKTSANNFRFYRRSNPWQIP